MEHKRESKPPTTLQLIAGFVNNIHKGETVAAVKNAVIDAGDKDIVSGTSYRTTPLPLAGMVQWLSATADGTEAAISMTMEVDDHPAASSPPSQCGRRKCVLLPSTADFLPRDTCDGPANTSALCDVGIYEFHAFYESIKTRDGVVARLSHLRHSSPRQMPPMQSAAQRTCGSASTARDTTSDPPSRAGATRDIARRATERRRSQRRRRSRPRGCRPRAVGPRYRGRRATHADGCSVARAMASLTI